jgi:hypothetical protein
MSDPSSGDALVPILRVSAERVKLEDASIDCDLIRTIQVDPVDDANKPVSEGDAIRIRAEDVAEEGGTLRLCQLSRREFLDSPALGDRGAAGGAKVPDPMNVAPRSPHPAPVAGLDDRDRRGPRQAARPPADRHQPIWAEWDAGDEKGLQDRSEQPDMPWNMGHAWRGSGSGG